MQLIDKFQETRRKMDMAIDRGKLWVLCSRKRSYIIFNLLMYILLCWHFLPLFLNYGWLGLQPFKLFGLVLGCGAGEVGYFSYQYYKRGNPLNLSGRQFKSRLFRLWIMMFSSVVTLAVMQGMIELYFNVNLVWLTGIGTGPRI